MTKLKELFKEKIKKVDGKYVLYPKSGGKRLGTHRSKEAAEDQEQAIQISKHGRSGRELDERRGISIGKKGMRFFTDQLINSMEHYSEREFISHLSKELGIDKKVMKRVWKNYLRISPQNRYKWWPRNWEKWLKKQGIVEDVIGIHKQINEVRWPDTQTARLLSQAFKDAKVKVQKVWEKGNHKYILRVRATDGNVNVKMELNVISNVIMMDTQSGHVRLGELQPGSRGRKLSKNLKMLSKLPAFGVAGFKGLKYKIESISQLQEIVREEIYTLMEATEKAKWTSDELALIKKLKVKVDGKQHKFKIEKSGPDKNRKAKFDTKDTWGIIEKWLIRGKTSYSGWFSAWEGGGLGWKGSEIKSSRDFDEEQNLKLLVSMFKKLQTKINRVWN